METNPKPSKTKSKTVIGFDYFYKRYKFKYLPEQIGFRGKIPRKVSLAVYKQIVNEYFDIYFKEIYHNNEKSYFLYTGTMEKILYSEKIMKHTNADGTPTLRKAGQTVGIMWYERPSVLFHFGVKIKKISSGRLSKIEKFFKSTTDINLIANFEKVYKQQFRNRNIFLNK